MYTNSLCESECCGCGACKDICPRLCITLVEKGAAGYVFPVVDEQECIKCGLCEKVCPFENTKSSELHQERSAWVALANDTHYRNQSGSGGAFGKLVETVAAERDEENLRIWGAAFAERFRVEHICIDSTDELSRLRGSKYLQSSTEGIFGEIAQQLEDGCFVIFSGCPCQVAALKRYLAAHARSGFDGELLTVDLVCHGVPSHKMFYKYICDTERKYGSKVDEVQFRFRERESGETPDSRRMRLVFDDGREIVEDKQHGAYLQMYHGGFGYRESCYACPYARAAREGDMTLKDAWSVKRYYPEYNAHEGVSLVLANTDAGNAWVQEMRKRDDMTVLPVDYASFSENAANSNGALNRPTVRPERNDDFMASLETMLFDDAVSKNCRPSLSKRIRKSLSSIFR